MTLATAILLFSFLNTHVGASWQDVGQESAQQPASSEPSQAAPNQAPTAPKAQSSSEANPSGTPSSAKPRSSIQKASGSKKPVPRKKPTPSGCDTTSANSSSGSNASTPDNTGAGDTSQADKTQAPPKNCPPEKIIVRQGGTVEPSIQLAGGDQAAQNRNAANQMLGSTEANLKKISGIQLTTEQKETVSQIRQFMDQSKAALASGDVERGKTLAWKAQLLSEDLIKPQK